MGCRAMLVAVAVTAVLVGPVVPAASADDVGSPTPAPAGRATPTVSPPSQQQIDDARNAMERLRQRGSRGTATPSTPATLSQVAGPLGASSTRSVTSRI